ncbi:MAG: hypothetical protein ACE5FG_02155 [Myxococcota bacterium]
MARRSKMAVLKRQRELKKAEKAALKREKREARAGTGPKTLDDQVASKEDLADYGFPSEEDAEETDSPD